MCDAMRAIMSNTGFGNRAVNMNMQMSMRGQTEDFSIDPLTLAQAERRNSAQTAPVHVKAGRCASNRAMRLMPIQ